MQSNLGRREEALRATQEAVDAYRGLAQQRPDAFLPDLARALNNLGAMQSNLGRREEALRATQEAVDIRRGLAQQRPDAFLPDLASALWSLGLVHLADGDHRRALDALAEGSRLIRPAHEKLPAAFHDRTLGLLRALRRAAREGNLPLPDDLAPWVDRILEDA
jgi:tetratricopeptide (TPR) repeat protein